MISPEILVIATVVLLIGGTVKGFLGIGLPAVAVSSLTLLIDPRTAISLILLPMLLSNIWQMMRGGPVIEIIHRYRRFAIVLFFSIGATVVLTQSVGDNVLLACVGAVTIIFSLLSWRKLIPVIPARHIGPFEILWAGLTGVVGGMTAVWGPPLGIYLATKRVEPDEFVQANGFLISVGSLPLLIAYVGVGHADWSVLGPSLLLIPPTFLGFAIGERLRKQTDPEIFRKTLLILFFLIGINLIYRAAFG